MSVFLYALRGDTRPGYISGGGGGRGVRGPGPESTYNDSAPSLQVTEAHAGGTIQKAAPAWVVYIRHASILICLVALRTAKNLSRECLAGLGLPLPQQAEHFDFQDGPCGNLPGCEHKTR